jgi:hypothetical protein
MSTTTNTIPTIPSFASHLEEELLQAIYASHVESNIRKGGRYTDKPYNQRNKNVTLAHVRHCIKETKAHNDVYGDIVTMKDLALKSPECKWETRLAIFALGEEFMARHYSDRGNAIEVFKLANGLLKGEETPKGDDQEEVVILEGELPAT